MYQHPIQLHEIHCPLKYFPLFFRLKVKIAGFFSLPPSHCLPGGDYLLGGGGARSVCVCGVGGRGLVTAPPLCYFQTLTSLMRGAVIEGVWRVRVCACALVRTVLMARAYGSSERLRTVSV